MANIFDNTIELPNSDIQQKTMNLIGFEAKYKRIYSNLKLLLDQDSLIDWSKKCALVDRGHKDQHNPRLGCKTAPKFFGFVLVV